MTTELENLRDLINDLEEIKKEIHKSKTPRISKSSIIDNCRDIVDTYFKEIRITLKDKIFEDEVETVNFGMENLLNSTRKRSSKLALLKILSKIISSLNIIEHIYLYKIGNDNEENEFDKLDEQIIETLNELGLQNASLSYLQGISDLQDMKRISWRGTAVEFREALRECLDKLAPDEEVMKQKNFILENNQTKPTMKQKVIFVLKSREIPTKELEPIKGTFDIIESTIGSFVRSIYTNANIATHVSNEKQAVIRIRKFVKIGLSELLSI